jgi:hypothetical protein
MDGGIMTEGAEEKLGVARLIGTPCSPNFLSWLQKKALTRGAGPAFM